MTRRSTLFPALALMAAVVATGAVAHAPGDALDEVMASRERFFEVVDLPAPPFDLVDGEGASSGEARGFDPANWSFLTARPEDGQDATWRVAEAYGIAFTPGENGQKAHGVIDRDGRFATEVHGLRFGPIDLYVTGLTTAPDGGEGATDAKWWARLTGSFE